MAIFKNGFETVNKKMFNVIESVRYETKQLLRTELSLKILSVYITKTISKPGKTPKITSYL